MCKQKSCFTQNIDYLIPLRCYLLLRILNSYRKCEYLQPEHRPTVALEINLKKKSIATYETSQIINFVIKVQPV